MSLATLIKARIAAQGPITIADYMSDCLMHPEFGYYTSRDPFGASGDFTTAPEISQMFGELIGLCLAHSWIDQGCPAPFALAELGPGRGTLMADALRATGGVAGFHAAMRVCLVETSQKLRIRQAKTLAPHDVAFFGRVEDLPPLPLFFIANEFFDALPIRQFQRTAKGWRERQIGLGPDGELALGLSPEVHPPDLEARLRDTREGDVIERSGLAISIIAELGAHLERHGGCGLVIDYGDWHSLGDTLQAVRAHKPAEVLDAPGLCDLTAHVDFEALAQATPSGFTKLTPQGMFLERLGMAQRAQMLANKLSGTALDAHIKAHRRLTHPDEMGNLFKVIGFYPRRATPPPGLDV